jgi:uncharacterized protein (DUF362 family)
MKRVEKIKVEKNFKDSVNKVVGGLGGFGKYVKTGDVVFIKPNFNTADPLPASTDIPFLKAVVELAYDAGAKLVMIGESSTMTMNSKKVMEKTGVYELLKMKKPPRIYIFEEGKWEKKSIKNAKYLKTVHIPEIIDRPDKIIFLPCLKTHKYAQFTGALKLSVGLMKPFERMALHARNIQEKVAELNTLFTPDLVIMDARKCFINEGPSFGDVENPNLILASEGRVAIDKEGIKIIQSYKGNSLNGIKPERLPQIKHAIDLGIN